MIWHYTTHADIIMDPIEGDIAYVRWWNNAIYQNKEDVLLVPLHKISNYKISMKYEQYPTDYDPYA